MTIQEGLLADENSTAEAEQNGRISLPQSWRKVVEKNGSQPKAAKSSTVQVPRLKPLRVIGNGAFGKFAATSTGQFLTENEFDNFRILGYVFEAFDQNRDMKVAVKRT